MANIKSSLKDIRRIRLRTERNRHVRSTLKTLRKRVLEVGDDPTKLRTATMRYMSALDKAAKVGVIHPNKVARHKAQVAKNLGPRPGETAAAPADA